MAIGCGCHTLRAAVVCHAIAGGGELDECRHFVEQALLYLGHSLEAAFEVSPIGLDLDAEVLLQTLNIIWG